MKHLLMIRIQCDSGDDPDILAATIANARHILQGIVAQMPMANFLTPIPDTYGTILATEIRDENNQQVAIITLQPKKG